MRAYKADTLTHAVSNVHIPAGMTEKVFYELMSDVAEAITGQQILDVEQITRCTACKYWDANSGLTARKCNKWGAITKQFDYCSYGEWREADGKEGI